MGVAKQGVDMVSVWAMNKGDNGEAEGSEEAEDMVGDTSTMSKDGV